MEAKPVSVLAKQIADDTRQRMHGWAGRNGIILHLVAGTVASSGDADYLEVGSLFGASAIAAARAKKECGLGGLVWCIDPMTWDAQEPTCRGFDSPRIDQLKRQHEIFQANTRLFGVEDIIRLLRQPSQPWPKHGPVGCILIDGWHYGPTPLVDVKCAAKTTATWIMLDDIAEEYPAVIRAMRWLLGRTDWMLRGMTGVTALFGRRRHNRPMYFQRGS